MKMTSRANAPAATRRIDYAESAALGISMLCLVHCLALPVLLTALPVLAAAVRMPEALHLWFLLFALPTSLFALILGYRQHRVAAPLIAGVIGLGLLAFAALWLEGQAVEVLVSVSGSLLLAGAHLGNWRARQRHHCSARR